ncbi:conserved hypothetical protein [Theileria orientalis strain Shintoku]|uniref:Uncharacterized protein n=1 Tax=Theileria orientalis strain Shintoku TaxID=869250 RepID=J4CCR4_THEOR|nr:conserved hypothetical protein [Theileria orientalis strain Shintoku]PVC50187.1 hypothetical protein MACL_00002466 [Theileria orientalis]BAM39847.1 conserved hypothetical protein [Theileria orientalis strain Shintoku]|eukprot:XP_009690148.1 conserved hypothetical protein [Theileria orientalis strain Shintoku]
MTFGWSKRPYTAPFLRDMVYNADLHIEDEKVRGNTLTRPRFNKHVAFSRKLSTLPLSTESSGLFDGNGGCTSTLDVKSLMPATTFGDQCSNKMPGTDILFMPKPSQLLAFALPVFVLMPNLTVFARHWFFYAPK